MNSSREELVFMSNFYKENGLYENLLQSIKQIAQQGIELSIEEGKLLNTAYKNLMGSRRTTWEALKELEQTDERNKGHQMTAIEYFKRKVKEELDYLCNEALSLIDNKILPSCSSSESQVLFLKMKGDYCRYLAECETGETKFKIAQMGLQIYQEATKIANIELKVTNATRLGLANNFAIFYYEILDDLHKARSVAKQAFDDALEKIEELDDEEFKEAGQILHLIRDNLTDWLRRDQVEEEQENQENV